MEIKHAVILAEKKIGPLGIAASAAGSAKYSQLKQMKKELENLKCKDLRDPATFRRCQQKYREINQRLEEGIP